MPFTKFRRVIQDAAGNVVPSASVTITVTSTGAAPSLYNDAAGLTPLFGNVLLTNADGEIECFTAPNTFTLVGVKNGQTIFTETHIPHIGPGQPINIDTTEVYADRNALITTLRDVVNPVGIVPSNWHVTVGNGDNTTFRGVSGGYFKAKDRAGILAGQRGVLYGAQFSIEPIHARNNFPFDDAVCAVFYNEGTASGTELAYFGRNAALTSGAGDAQAAIGIDAWANAALYTTGTYIWGWDALWGPVPATFTSGMIRAPNNTAVIVARQSSGSTDVEMVKLNAANNPVFFGQEQITIRDVSPAPTLGADSGTYTTASITSARYTKHNRIVNFTATVTVTDKGTAAYLRVPLPIQATVHGGCGSGVNSTDGIGLAVTIAANGTYARATVASTGADPLINGKSYIINVAYEVAA